MPRRSTRTTKKKAETSPAPKRTRKTSKKQQPAEETVEEPKEEEKESPAGAEERKEEEEEVKGKEEHREEPKARTGGEEAQTKVLEKGRIYFLYRPKVGVEEVEDWEDVQRLYMVLWPGAPGIEKEAEKAEEKIKSKVEKSEAEKKGIERIFVIPKKILPSPQDHQKHWAFVDRVGERKEVVEALEQGYYGTKTRGTRRLAGARPAGEGVYALVQKGRNCYLAYVLELPKDITEVQHSFNIEKEASIILNVKNPDMPTPYGFPRMQGGRKPEYPEELKKKFQESLMNQPYRFIPPNPPQFLDYEGTELVLIGGREDIISELGKSAQLLEEIEGMELKGLKDDKLFQELNLDMKEHPPEPLHGEWK